MCTFCQQNKQFMVEMLLNFVFFSSIGNCLVMKFCKCPLWAIVDINYARNLSSD